MSRSLPQIDFQSEEERRDILERGLELMRQGKIPENAIQRGVRYRKKILSGFCPKVSIRFINERVGQGVFAEEVLKARSYVGEYTGVVRENVRIYFVPLNNYCYEYPVPDEMGRSFVIDATEGNFTRYINHSYRPNLKPLYAFLDGFYHLIFIALRQIEIGEQLCYDYGRNYWIIRPGPEELDLSPCEVYR
ncbi:MAG: SET domain-containing protein-lysine N-methyltransferase [Chlamydiales bacterium]